VFENIRALLRRESAEQESVDLSGLARRVSNAFGDEFKRHNITANVELAQALPVVTGHGGQLQEVVFNLIQNAIEAMELVPEDSRVLQVRTERHGDVIRLTVQDSGPGFDENKLDKLFDKFVSTKPGGMGLGLAICRMIIERHEGRISASPADPRGTVFRVDLPAAK